MRIIERKQSRNLEKDRRKIRKIIRFGSMKDKSLCMPILVPGITI